MSINISDIEIEIDTNGVYIGAVKNQIKKILTNNGYKCVTDGSKITTVQKLIHTTSTSTSVSVSVGGNVILNSVDITSGTSSVSSSTSTSVSVNGNIILNSVKQNKQNKQNIQNITIIDILKKENISTEVRTVLERVKLWRKINANVSKEGLKELRLYKF